MTALFSEMPSGKRTKWLAWANSHDWGAAAARWSADGSMQVECIVVHAGTDTAEVEAFTATNPGDLRAWAGY